MPNKLIILGFSSSFLLLSSCQINTQQISNNNQQISPQQQAVNTEKLDIGTKLNPVIGQTIYIPIYSHIYFGNNARIYDLTVTISFHNTDTDNPIILKSVKYYDTKGNLLEEYLSQPVKLNPLASTDFYINETDTRGGIGANFLIEWVAESHISQPIAESVMIGATGTQGISFLSQGRVIKNLNKAK